MLRCYIILRDHTFMTSIKNNQFCDSHPLHPQKWTIDLLFKNRICKHVKDFKTFPPTSLLNGRHKRMVLNGKIWNTLYLARTSSFCNSIPCSGYLALPGVKLKFEKYIVKNMNTLFFESTVIKADIKDFVFPKKIL